MNHLMVFSINVNCPRKTYEILSDTTNPYRKSIDTALTAVIPSGVYIKNLNLRATLFKSLIFSSSDIKISSKDLSDLIKKIENQKGLMIAVSTGGPKIQDVNKQYKNDRIEILKKLQEIEIEDPNPYPDLWSWYGKWSDGSLPSWQSRRIYINMLYQPLLDSLMIRQKTSTPVRPQEPTGWARVDRNVDKINKTLVVANNEEDFQSVGLLCREAIISLAQAVYIPEKHVSLDGVRPSSTDAKRMLESYISTELTGGTNEVQRKFAKTTFQLSVDLQHKRTASFREASLCAEATKIHY